MLVLSTCLLFVTLPATDPTPDIVAAHLSEKLDCNVTKTKGTVTKLLFGCQSDATDDHMRLLRHFPALTELSLVGGDLTDAGVEHIVASKTLRRLMLNQEAITEKSLERIAGLTDLEHLEHLELWGVSLTEAGVGHLKKLPNLKSLRIRNAEMPAAAAKWFAGFPKLEQLRLPRAPQTEAGLKAFQDALPKTKVTR